MFCPNCGKDNDNSKSFCGNCGTSLVRSPANPIPHKPKNNNLIIGLIGLIVCIILVAIFFNPLGHLNTNPSPQKSVVTPIPTLKTHYALNEPATDGTLRITILDTHESFERPNTKTFGISLKLPKFSFIFHTTKNFSRYKPECFYVCSV